MPDHSGARTGLSVPAQDSNLRTLAFYIVILKIKEWQNIWFDKTGCLEACQKRCEELVAILWIRLKLFLEHHRFCLHPLLRRRNPCYEDTGRLYPMALHVFFTRKTKHLEGDRLPVCTQA